MEPGSLVLLLVVLGMVGLALWLREGERNQERAALILPQTPQECIDGATAFMVQRGFAIAHKSPSSATFTRPKKPRADVGLLLLLLGIVPGLLYFGLYKGVYTLSLEATPEQGGTQLVVSGDDRTGRQVLAQWLGQSAG